MPGLQSSSSSEDEEDIWLVAKYTWLKVPWPSTPRARQRRRFWSYRPDASKNSASDCLLLVLDPGTEVKDESAALIDDSLGGGVGGFSMGVKPLASERWGSRRRWLSAAFFNSVLTRVPDTVDMRLGINMGSGMYSLILRFLVWWVWGWASLPSCRCLVSSAGAGAGAGAGQDVRLAYPFFALIEGPG